MPQGTDGVVSWPKSSAAFRFAQQAPFPLARLLLQPSALQQGPSLPTPQVQEGRASPKTYRQLWTDEDIHVGGRKARIPCLTSKADWSTTARHPATHGL